MNRDNYVILGVPWRVRVISGGDPRIDADCGKCDFANHTIWICADMLPSERVETLLHETTHAIAAGMKSCDLTEEDTLRWFSAILYDTLTRNEVTLTE